MKDEDTVRRFRFGITLKVVQIRAISFRNARSNTCVLYYIVLCTLDDWHHVELEADSDSQ